MCCGKYMVVRSGYQSSLFLGVVTPQHKDYGLLSAVELGNNAVGKYLPALAAVASRRSPAHGKHAVEKEDTVIRPIIKTAVRRRDKADIILQFFIYIFK